MVPPVLMKYTPIGFSDKDTRYIIDILDDPRGWADVGYVFKMVPVNEADVIIYKKSRLAMSKRFQRPDLAGMSVCVRSVPIEIWIHNDNWSSPPKNFIGSKSVYQAYVIQHEMGHAIGYSHHDPLPDPTLPCPVMYQQTRGTIDRCRSNPWVSESSGR